MDRSSLSKAYQAHFLVKASAFGLGNTQEHKWDYDIAGAGP